MQPYLGACEGSRRLCCQQVGGVSRTRERGHAVYSSSLVQRVTDDCRKGMASMVQAHEIHPRVRVPTCSHAIRLGSSTLTNLCPPSPTLVNQCRCHHDSKEATRTYS